MAYSLNPLPQVADVNIKPPVFAFNDGWKPGAPSTFTGTLVNGTSIDNTNKQLAHVCDFVSELQKHSTKEILKGCSKPNS